MSGILNDISSDVKSGAKSVGGIMQGHRVADFLLRHWKMALLFVVMIVLHINSRYDYENQVERIRTLRSELTDLQIRQNIISSELMKTTLEANIQDRVNERGLGLSPADTSLIKIKN